MKDIKSKIDKILDKKVNRKKFLQILGVSAAAIPLLSPTVAAKFFLRQTDGTLIDIDDLSPGSATWGSIGGTLSNQTDLQTALDDKANDNEVVKITGTQTIGGAKTFSTIPILPASDPTTDNQAVRKAYVDAQVGGSGGVGSGTTGQTLRHNGASWISNSTLYNNGTNIGIGTSNPNSNYKLEVTGTIGTPNRGSIKAGLRLSLGQSGGNYDGIGYNVRFTDTSSVWNYEAGDTASLLTFNSGGFTFKTAPTGTASNPITFSDRVNILQTGSVGIGVTNPTEKLEVLGNTEITGDLGVDGNTGVTGYVDVLGSFRVNTTIVIDSSRNIVNAGTGTFTGTVTAATPTAGTHLATKDYVDTTSSGAATWGSIGGTLSNQTDLQNALNLKADDSAVVKLTGAQSVGGVKTFTSIPILPASSPTTDNEAVRKKYVDDAIVTAGGEAVWGGITGTLSNQTDLQTALDTKADDSAVVKLTGAQTVAGVKTFSNNIIANGDVGIGTSVPTDLLDVFSSSNNQRLIRISHPTSPTEAAGFIGFNSDGTTNNNVVTLGAQYSTAYYNVLNIQRSTRYIGIGTVTPTQVLDVDGKIRMRNETEVTDGTDIVATKGYVDSVGGGSGETAVWGSVTGTLSNQTDLQTALDAKADDSAVVKLTGDQTVAGAKTFSATPLTLSADTTVLSFSSVTGTKTISTGGTTHLNLTPGGNVGIGSAAPTEKLDVVGKTKSSSGFETGSYEIVYNADTESLDFNFIG